MSEEELIETLRAFEKNRVEQLEEPARNLFYAIMKIAGERDRLNNIIETFEEELERESNMKEEDTCLEHNTFIDIKNTLKSVLKRFQELKGSDKEWIQIKELIKIY